MIISQKSLQLLFITINVTITSKVFHLMLSLWGRMHLICLGSETFHFPSKPGIKKSVSVSGSLEKKEGDSPALVLTLALF